MIGFVLVGSFFAAHFLGTAHNAPASVIPGSKAPWKVEVVNAVGENGLAQRVTDRLRHLGYDVIDVRSARIEGKSLCRVIDRSGNQQAAAQIASALGLPPERVQSQVDKTLFLDVSVIIGSDHRSFTPLTAEER